LERQSVSLAESARTATAVVGANGRHVIHKLVRGGEVTLVEVRQLTLPNTCVRGGQRDIDSSDGSWYNPDSGSRAQTKHYIR
jgi:hypothetical protein